MVIRFTEFIRHNDRDIGLYVIQEAEEVEFLCFKVYIRDGENVVNALCKKEDNDWKIILQEIPEWINEIKPLLVSTIECRII